MIDMSGEEHVLVDDGLTPAGWRRGSGQSPAEHQLGGSAGRSSVGATHAVPAQGKLSERTCSVTPAQVMSDMAGCRAG